MSGKQRSVTYKQSIQVRVRAKMPLVYDFLLTAEFNGVFESVTTTRTKEKDPNEVKEKQDDM